MERNETAGEVEGEEKQTGLYLGTKKKLILRVRNCTGRSFASRLVSHKKSLYNINMFHEFKSEAVLDH